MRKNSPNKDKKHLHDKDRKRQPFVEVTHPERIAKILHRLLNAKAEKRTEAVLARLHPADIAQVLTLLSVPEVKQIIQILFRLRKGAATIIELPESLVKEVIADLEADSIAAILRRLDPDDAVDILQGLPEERHQEVLNILNIDEVTELERLLAHDEDSAGALMNPDYFALSNKLLVQDAIKQIRSEGEKLKTVFYIYVIDEWNKLVGTISMRDLLLAHDDTQIAALTDENVVSVTTQTPDAAVAELIAKYDLLALPVVDQENKLLGVITIDDVVDVLQEAATEELYRMVALDEDDRVFSPAPRSIRLRLPWLTLNFITAMGAALTVGLFENIISQVVALAALMPIVAGMGGNAGAQTLTVVIRGMALGELSQVNARRAVMKELTVGLVNGLLLGVMAGLLAWLWKGMWWLGLLLSVSMVINLCVAALGGATIPLVLKRLRLDPALGSSIFLTTLTDIIGFFTLLGLASWLIPILGLK